MESNLYIKSNRLYYSSRQSDNLECVIKLITQTASKQAALGPFLIFNEASALKQLKHKNIVKYFGQGIGMLHSFDEFTGNQTTEQAWYVVLQYYKGGSLYDIIYRYPFKKSLTKKIFRELVEAVAHMHATGWAHRDIKPHNVMFDNDLNTQLIDFGLSCPAEGEFSDGLSYLILGSRLYWPPELSYTCYPYGYIPMKMDIFSLGITLFEMRYVLCPMLQNVPCWNKDIYQQDLFWKQIESHTSIHTDPLLKSLISSILTPNPLCRPSAEDILKHPWLKRKRQH